MSRYPHWPFVSAFDLYTRRLHPRYPAMTTLYPLHPRPGRPVLLPIGVSAIDFYTGRTRLFVAVPHDPRQPFTFWEMTQRRG